MNPKLSLAIGILCISFSPILVKLAHEPAITAAFYRIFIAWICLLPYCLVKGLVKIELKNLWTALLGGVIFASDMAVWNISLLKISATVSTLLANLAPVWVGLLGFLLWRQRSGWLFWAGTGVAIVGMVVLVGYQNIINLQVNSGVLLAVLASFLYANYIMVTKNILQRVNTITFMFYSMLASCVVLFAMMLFEGAELVHFPASSWYNFIGMGLVCQLAGWITINYSIKLLPSTKVAITLLSQTVVTGIIAVLMLNEQLGIAEIAGSAIVLAGIAITFLKPSKTNIS